MTADVKAVDAILVEMNKPKPLEVPPPEPRDEKGAKGKKGKVTFHLNTSRREGRSQNRML